MEQISWQIVPRSQKIKTVPRKTNEIHPSLIQRKTNTYTHSSNGSSSKPSSNSSPEHTQNSSPKISQKNSSPEISQKNSSPSPLTVNKLLASSPKATAASSSDDSEDDNGDDSKSTTTHITTKTTTSHQSTSPSTIKSTLKTNLPSTTLSSNTAFITPSAQEPQIPCLTGDSITSLSCKDSTQYYCNLTDHMCYSRVEDNSPCQDDTVCNLNSACSGNVCVPSGSSNDNSPIDAGKVAMIVGPILGALLLFAILFLFICCRRRRKKRSENDIFGSMDDNSYPFAARPNSFSSSTPTPVPITPLARNSPEDNELENQTNTWNQTNSNTIWNQANTNQTNTTTTTYLSGTSTFNDVASEQTTENVRLSKYLYISNALNIGNNNIRDSNSSSSGETDTRTGTPIRPFIVNGVSSEMNSPTLPLEDLTDRDRGSTVSYFTNNSNRDSDVLPTMDQDEFRKSPESVYLGLEFTQPETRPSKGRYTMGSMYSTYSTYSQDYSNYPASPTTYNLLRGVQSSVTTGKIDHSRLRNDSFSTVTTQTISQTYDDSRSSYIQLNAPIFSNFNNNASGSNSLANTLTHEYSDSTYSTASSLNSNSNNSNSTSNSDHTVTQKNMYSTNRSDGQTRKYGNQY
ncbi:1314_t:CDS:2 [Dentiscutata erythropus]|uniref:1314_t:CDS:1 n=1 Tax=Dentiscutata erythropus TaxID=1348616 RepID=A0A9N9GK46_9GLOM|nr:1314_t:CDS:2 [Dentiscutata erythropus]